MRIAVVIPCHNAQRWISATLASVARQTRPPDQIVVVNDNSTDDSAGVVQASGLPITLLTTQHGNAAAARNAGFEVLDADWVALLDADDQWYPHHLEQAERLLADTDAVAYCAQHDFMELDEQRVPLPACFWQGYSASRAGLSADDYVNLMAQQIHFGHSTVLYRVSRLRAVGGFDVSQKRRHDIDLWLRMLAGHRWAWGVQPAASYRYRTPGSISRHTVEVAYYALRALVKNLDAYPQPAFRQLVDSYAKRAASVALHETDDPAMRQQLRELAWPHLSGKYRCFYRVADVCPWPLRVGVWLKRNTWNALRRKRRQQREAAALLERSQ